MTNGLRNTLSLILGSCFNFIFLWLTALVDALPVPNMLKSTFELFGAYYTNVMLLLFSLLASVIILLITRKAFTLFSNQNVFFLALPIILFISYVYSVLDFEFEPLIWASVPTLLIAFILRHPELERSL